MTGPLRGVDCFAPPAGLFFKILELSSLRETIPFSDEAFYDRVRRVVKKESFFKTWFSRTFVTQENDREVVLKVATPLAMDWIEKKYLSQLKVEIKELWDMDLKLEEGTSGEHSFKPVVSESFSTEDSFSMTRTSPVKLEAPIRRHREFTFDNFITGPENLMAYTAAQGVATGSAHVHSPLFIVGGHGTGKTHLVSCIQDACPQSQVLCWHAEEFANAYIQAMQSGELERFRAQIRSKRVVIIEDLDFFLEGAKTKTKEELLHSLKVLKRDHRHIVITSNEPAGRFSPSAPKLSNFLLGGLTVKLDNMSSISRKKMVEHGLASFACPLSPKSVEFVQSIAFKNPRELKGAIQQLSAYSVLKNESLPLSVIKDVLSDHLRMSGELASTPESQDLHSVARLVCDAFGVSLQKLLSPSRERYVSLSRHVAMALSYDFHFTLKEIGQFYGGRLHQSVLFGIKKVSAKREKDLDFQRTYLKLQQELKSSLKS